MIFFRRRCHKPDWLFQRFAGRVILVHEGFPPLWLEELLKQGGGAGYFRLDWRQCRERPETELERFIHEHVLPLECPLPVIMRVEKDAILLRHLRRGEGWLLPSDMSWLLAELADRHHFRLEKEGEKLTTKAGIPLTDNEINYDFG